MAIRNEGEGEGEGEMMLKRRNKTRGAPRNKPVDSSGTMICKIATRRMDTTLFVRTGGAVHLV